MLKDLALLVDPATKGAGSYALSLAQLPSAHLTTVPADVEPALAAYTELRYDIIVANREDRHDAIATRAAHIHMDGLAQGLTVNMLPIDDYSDNMLDALVHSSRLFDLVIVEQASREQADGRSPIIAASVFKSGRPVLIVPHIRPGPASLGKALIAWDGSAPAARALGDAMPLLKRAEHVTILEETCPSPERYDGTALKQHLARHGIDARFERTPTSGDIGKTLLSYAVEIDADLLVMGAYGHSRLREEIFGGTTKTIMGRTTIPVLMSR